MLIRLNPKKIVIVSSAPQIRYPDCYGIDMSRLDKFIAFKAALELHKDKKTYNKVIKVVYKNCLKALSVGGDIENNYVKDVYRPFSPEQISKKMAEMLLGDESKVKLQIIFQKIENLHKSCPNHKGDWYFTGDYPTVGGNKVVNQAFINYVENKKGRAY